MEIEPNVIYQNKQFLWTEKVGPISVIDLVFFKFKIKKDLKDLIFCSFLKKKKKVKNPFVVF